MARRIDTLWGPYRIIQEDGYFKLGQDSVLLADFAAVPHRGKIIDFGCGSGVLGLLLCAREPQVTVLGVEIQRECADLARENSALNGFDSRFEVVCGDIREYAEYLPCGGMDYAISNPPYFQTDAGFPAKLGSKRTARQDGCCPLSQLFDAVSYCLKYGGKFALVQKPERLTDIFCGMRQVGLEVKKLRFVQKDAESTPSTVLLEARKGGAPDLRVLKPLLLRQEDGRPTEELIKIYRGTLR